MAKVPKDHPVKPLRFNSNGYRMAKVLSQCGTCHRYWDDGVVTSMTPAPAARCPFEAYHAH